MRDSYDMTQVRQHSDWVLHLLPLQQMSCKPLWKKPDPNDVTWYLRRRHALSLQTIRQLELGLLLAQVHLTHNQKKHLSLALIACIYMGPIGICVTIYLWHVVALNRLLWKRGIPTGTLSEIFGGDSVQRRRDENVSMWHRDENRTLLLVLFGSDVGYLSLKYFIYADRWGSVRFTATYGSQNVPHVGLYGVSMHWCVPTTGKKLV